MFRKIEKPHSVRTSDVVPMLRVMLNPVPIHKVTWELISNLMEFLNSGMQLVGPHFFHIFLTNYSRNFAWPHPGNAHDCDTLPMLYPTSYIYSERNLSADTEVLTMLLFILRWVWCLCPQLIINMHLSITINNCPCNKYVTVYIISFSPCWDSRLKQSLFSWGE